MRLTKVCVCVSVCPCVHSCPAGHLAGKVRVDQRHLKCPEEGGSRFFLGEEFVPASQILCVILREHRECGIRKPRLLKSWCLTFSKSFNSESALVLVL